MSKTRTSTKTKAGTPRKRRAGGGRKPLSADGSLLARQVSTRLSVEEARDLRLMALRLGVSESSVLRRALAMLVANWLDP